MLAHKEAMRLEGIKEAESEAMLLAIQDMETEKQWNKRYTAWGKEAMQRRLLMEEVEEKFTKFSGERRDAREILCNTTCFCKNFKQNCLQNAKLGSAQISNSSSEIGIRFWDPKSKF